MDCTGVFMDEPMSAFLPQTAMSLAHVQPVIIKAPTKSSQTRPHAAMLENILIKLPEVLSKVAATNRTLTIGEWENTFAHRGARNEPINVDPEQQPPRPNNPRNPAAMASREPTRTALVSTHSHEASPHEHGNGTPAENQAQPDAPHANVPRSAAAATPTDDPNQDNMEHHDPPPHPQAHVEEHHPWHPDRLLRSAELQPLTIDFEQMRREASFFRGTAYDKCGTAQHHSANMKEAQAAARKVILATQKAKLNLTLPHNGGFREMIESHMRDIHLHRQLCITTAIDAYREVALKRWQIPPDDKQVLLLTHAWLDCVNHIERTPQTCGATEMTTNPTYSVQAIRSMAESSDNEEAHTPEYILGEIARLTTGDSSRGDTISTADIANRLAKLSTTLPYRRRTENLSLFAERKLIATMNKVNSTTTQQRVKHGQHTKLMRQPSTSRSNCQPSQVTSPRPHASS